MSVERTFRIGMPNRGRLGDLSKSIFINELGWMHGSVMASRSYAHYSIDGKVEFIFARSKDLPRLQRQNVIDVCITGKDYVEDSDETLLEILDLGLCPGDVSILVPPQSCIRTCEDLEGLTIATQLPNIAKRWIRMNNLQTTQLLVNEGSNEVYPYLGLADATLDIVSSGDTARANGLIPIIQVLHSSGRLFTTDELYFKQRARIDELVGNLKEKYIK